jgi:epoxyqueuosine reductase
MIRKSLGYKRLTSHGGVGEMNHEQAVRGVIQEFAANSPLNRLQHIDGSPIFDAPLVGVADGYDPLFEQYKAIIGPFHLTPLELIQQAVGEGRSASHNDLATLRVICWVLPTNDTTRQSNRNESTGPSERWHHTKFYGETFNDALRNQVVTWLQEQGYLAVAPLLSPVYLERKKSQLLTSSWSERHALYAAGLGTFGLSDGFITPRGMAMRCGSVITNLPLAVTPRIYATHTQNCLHYDKGACGKCIARCPAGAISNAGHDKVKCQHYLDVTLKPVRIRYNVDTITCGLCQTGVPCEACIPARSEH